MSLQRAAFLPSQPHQWLLPMFVLGSLILTAPLSAQESVVPGAPEVGDSAPQLELKSLKGETVKLSELTEKGPVVLVVLRGFPGYQCPICSRQVADLIRHTDAFKEANAQVLFVYPGDVDDLEKKAKEFLGDTKLPDQFSMLLDPEYDMLLKWNLRWDAPRETSYPSTFVIDGDGTIQFATISKSHGGRAKTDDVVKAVKSLKTDSK